MTTKLYTTEDFANAEFARHRNGGVAARAHYISHICPWSTTGGWRSDAEMAGGGWVPVRETTMTDNDGRVERIKRQIAEQDIVITRRNREIQRLRAEVKAAGVITLDALHAAWEGAEQGEVADGDVIIHRALDGEHFTVWVTGGGWHTDRNGGGARILHRAPKPARPEGAEGLEALLDEWGDLTRSEESTPLADWLAERGVRVTEGGGE